MKYLYLALIILGILQILYAVNYLVQGNTNSEVIMGIGTGVIMLVGGIELKKKINNQN